MSGPLPAAAAAALASLLLVGLWRALALRRAWLDHPNARSSHHRPTPTGAGVALLAALLLAALPAAGAADRRLLAAFAPGAVLLAAVGLLDDRRGLPIGLRLAAQAAATAWLLWALAVPLPWWPVLLPAVLWWINLYNFMDGIDGIAAGEALAVAAAALILGAAGLPAPPAVLGAAAGAAAGFLYWNRPPARVFMGDAGSAPLGLLFAAPAIDAFPDPAALAAWLILPGAFVVDASATLAMRALAGEPVHRPHRSHAYQIAARRWGHGPVSLAYAALTAAWFAPWAFAACRGVPPLLAVAAAYAPPAAVVYALRRAAGAVQQRSVDPL